MKRCIIINKDQGVFHLANRSMDMFFIKPYGIKTKNFIIPTETKPLIPPLLPANKNRRRNMTQQLKPVALFAYGVVERTRQ